MRRSIHDFWVAARLGPRVWGDLLRAAWELALARNRLDSVPSAEFLLPGSGEPDGASPRDAALLVERVAFAVPRVAARVPWKSDCLVQALAAQRWLRRKHIATTVNIGVPRVRSGNFEAHAWLRHGDRIVTGGDISGYEPLTRADGQPAPPLRGLGS